MESRKNYLKNKDQLERTNECFIAPGSKPSAHMKLSTTDHIPSRVGKPSNFFSLREQMNQNKGNVPAKNEPSTSFAVDEDKVRRRTFSFNPKNMLLREKGMAALN